MADDVRNYAVSVCIVEQLTFKPQLPPTDEELADDNAEEEHRTPDSGILVIRHRSIPMMTRILSARTLSSSDGAVHCLDTLDDSDKRSRENEQALTYSRPFESYKSWIDVEPAWTTFAELAVFKHVPGP